LLLLVVFNPLVALAGSGGGGVGSCCCCGFSVSDVFSSEKELPASPAPLRAAVTAGKAPFAGSATQAGNRCTRSTPRVLAEKKGERRQRKREWEKRSQEDRRANEQQKKIERKRKRKECSIKSIIHYQSAGSSGACWYMSKAFAHSASMKATRGGTSAGGAWPFSSAGQSIGALVSVLGAASPEEAAVASAEVKNACLRTSLEELVPSRSFKS
jgi:hypothetical protein